jgi:hypothetical protein
MVKHSIRYALLVSLALAAAGCTAPPRHALANLPGKDACFWTRTIFDWTVLDDSTILVRAPSPNAAYLIKLFAPIPGLKFHEELGFQGGDGQPGQFCRQNGYVIARGPIPDRQPVIAVQAVTAGEARQLVTGAGSPASRPASKPGGIPAS